jgi:hypothetical protein
MNRTLERSGYAANAVAVLPVKHRFSDGLSGGGNEFAGGKSHVNDVEAFLRCFPASAGLTAAWSCQKKIRKPFYARPKRHIQPERYAKYQMQIFWKYFTKALT